MNLHWRFPTLAISLAAVLLAACGSSGTASKGASSPYAPTPTAKTPALTTPVVSTPAPTTTPVATPASSVIVRLNMNLGPILADASGRTLYQFLPEKGGKIVCTGTCLTYWPADLAPTVAAGSGVTRQVAVIVRPDGAQQVSYNTWPLYFFSGDRGPDQANGQGIVGFGGRWLVATPRLKP